MAVTPDKDAQERTDMTGSDRAAVLSPVSQASEMPAVLEVIRNRMRTKNLDDGFRVGLSLEGGGMRGVISGAMLIALRDIGAADAIDCYFGTSSGSINLSYFLTGGDGMRSLSTTTIWPRGAFSRDEGSLEERRRWIWITSSTR